MLLEQEIKELEKLSLKNDSIKKIFDFYMEAQEDGVKAFGISLNKKLITLSEQIDEADISISKIDDKVFDRIFKAMVDGGKIAENLRNINNESRMDKQKNGSSKGHDGKVVL